MKKGWGGEVRGKRTVVKGKGGGRDRAMLETNHMNLRNARDQPHEPEQC